MRIYSFWQLKTRGELVHLGRLFAIALHWELTKKTRGMWEKAECFSYDSGLWEESGHFLGKPGNPPACFSLWKNILAHRVKDSSGHRSRPTGAGKRKILYLVVGSRNLLSPITKNLLTLPEKDC